MPIGPLMYAAIAALIFAAGFAAGFKVEWNACRAKDAERVEQNLRAVQEAVAARKVDEDKLAAVATAYEQAKALASQRAQVIRVESTHEVQKIEYRCLLPESGERLRLDAVRAANSAAGYDTGKPDAAVPADTGAAGKGSGRVADSLFGSDGDVR